MSVETTTNIEQRSFLLEGTHKTKTDATLTTDAGRTTDVAPWTLFGFNPATGKYVPWASDLATGAQTNLAIYQGDAIASADIVAGDVTDLAVVIGGERSFAEDLLVFDNGTDTLDTAVGTGTAQTTARKMLADLGLFAKKTETVGK